MTAQFKVGSVYRDGRGSVVRVDEAVGQITSPRLREFYEHYGLQVSQLSGKDWLYYGWRRATDGAHSDDGAEYSLLPGELHNVNGQWVPVAEEAPKTEVERILDEMIEQTRTDASAIRAANTEPQRAPLAYFTEKAKFDPWAGYFNEPTDAADWQDTYFPR